MGVLILIRFENNRMPNTMDCLIVCTLYAKKSVKNVCQEVPEESKGNL